MTIPESQLQTWSSLGAIVLSQQTHESIRTALSRYIWPSGVTYEPYLQGSYKNSTNIRGDSDVDLVVELTSVHYSNLTDAEKVQMGLTTAEYSWEKFRNDVITALTNYYGGQYIDSSGNNSLKLLPNSGRLKADVVVAATYCHYEKMRLIAYGINYWTIQGGERIYNFPKLHFDNEVSKNSQQRTNGWYKPTVRVFKNARNRVIETNSIFPKQFPSYFIECLLYNVPDGKFGGSFQSTFRESLIWLNGELNGGSWEKFRCPNGMYDLFGSSTVHWNINDAREFVAQLLKLWNGW